jgi:hypothetical protein
MTPEGRSVDLELGFCHAGGSEYDDFALLKALGAKWTRLDFPWEHIEPEQGMWTFDRFDDIVETAEKNGTKVLVILDYDTPWMHPPGKRERRITPENLPLWLTYVEKVARRYAGRVGGFEVWNEPNFGRFWDGTDEEFFALTAATVETLKRVAPETPVVVGSLMYHTITGGPGYLRRLLKSGAVQGADAVSLHPYGFSAEAAAKRVAEAGEMLTEYGFDGSVWITEVGFPTGGGYPHKVSEAEQPGRVIKTITLAAVSGVEVLTWYELKDKHMPGEAPPGTSSEAFFGLVRPDGSFKPGGVAFGAMARRLRGSRYAPEILMSDFPESRLEVHPFTRVDGDDFVVLWSRGGRYEVVLEGFTGRPRVVDPGREESRTMDPGEILPVGPDPILIDGRIGGNGLRLDRR